MTSMPLNLLIVQTIEKFGRLPRSFLYHRVPASQDEVERQIKILAQQGAIRIEGDQVVSVDADQVASAQGK